MAKPRTRKPKSEEQPVDGVENTSAESVDPSSDIAQDSQPAGVDETELAPDVTQGTSEAPSEAVVDADESVDLAQPTEDAPAEDAITTATEETAPEAPDHPEPAILPPPAAAPVKRGGFMPLFLGGVIAAIVGAGAAIYTLPKLPPQFAAWFPAAPESSAIADIDAKQNALSSKIDALSSQLAALKSAQPPAPDLSGVQGALDQIGSEVRANKSTLDDLKKQMSGFEASGAAVDATTKAQIEAVAKAAQDRIDQAEQQAKTLQDQSQAAAKAAMAQAASARMKAALDAGAPLDPARADLQAAGVSIPAALSGDVPTLQSLQASFPEAARLALAAARKAGSGASLGDKLGAFLLTQTGARSLTPQAGDGPDAVLSRAQADVNTGDLKAALTEIAKLPEAARPALSDWSTQAQARVAALDAAGQLGQNQ
ncbi:COG4223 family protein [Thioclava sp. 15-R06ZXC-3]|uniref:COG4223 family protein n=1 Tax=Thioclava arctica TaxID=3238301 RepID=A0ABV3TIN0_9RHOB